VFLALLPFELRAPQTREVSLDVQGPTWLLAAAAVLFPYNGVLYMIETVSWLRRRQPAGLPGWLPFQPGDIPQRRPWLGLFLVLVSFFFGCVALVGFIPRLHHSS
jgi:hypothetical protein